MIIAAFLATYATYAIRCRKLCRAKSIAYFLIISKGAKMNKPIKTVLGGVVFVVILIGLWNLFDFIWKTWINGSGYLFSSSYHILYPLGIGVVLYLILFVFHTVKNKNK